MRLENNIPEHEVRAFENAAVMNTFMDNNMNSTQGGNSSLSTVWVPFHKADTRLHGSLPGYIFDINTNEDNETVIGFALYSNATNQQRMGKIRHYATLVEVPMMVSLQRQIRTQLTLVWPNNIV